MTESDSIPNSSFINYHPEIDYTVKPFHTEGIMRNGKFRSKSP